MTVEFEVAWLVIAIKIAFIVLVLGSLIMTYNAIVRFIEMHKKLKGELATTTEFNEKDVMGLLTNINDRLVNVESTLKNHLEEHETGEVD